MPELIIPNEPEAYRQLHCVWLIGLLTEHDDVPFNNSILNKVEVEQALNAIRHIGYDRMSLSHLSIIMLGVSRILLNKAKSFTSSQNLLFDSNETSLEIARKERCMDSSLILADYIKSILEDTIEEVGCNSPSGTLKTFKKKNNKRLKIDHSTQLYQSSFSVESVLGKKLPNLGMNKLSIRLECDKAENLMRKSVRKLPSKLNYLFNLSLIDSSKTRSLTCDMPTMPETTSQSLVSMRMSAHSFNDNTVGNDTHNVEDNALVTLPPSTNQQQQANDIPKGLTVMNEEQMSRDPTSTPYMCTFDVDHTKPIWCQYFLEPELTIFRKPLSDANRTSTELKSRQTFGSHITSIKFKTAKLGDSSLFKLARDNFNPIVDNIGDKKDNKVFMQKKVNTLFTEWPYKTDHVSFEQLLKGNTGKEVMDKYNTATHFLALLELASEKVIRLDQQSDGTLIIYRSSPM